MSNKTKTDLELFNPSDVEFSFPYSKRHDEVFIKLKATEGKMNLMKTYLALVMLVEKLESDLGILEQASEEEH